MKIYLLYYLYGNVVLLYNRFQLRKTVLPRLKEPTTHGPFSDKAEQIFKIDVICHLITITLYPII